MNPIERFFTVATYKIKTMPAALKALILILIAAVIALVVMAQTGVLATIGMTPEEKAAYQQQQAEIASAENAAKVAQARIEEENRNGYKRFSSPNLTDEEAATVNFIHACQDGDMDLVSQYLNTPDVFNESNLKTWCSDTGIDVFFNYDDENRVVAIKDEDIMDEKGNKVIGTARTACIWYANATEMTKFYIEPNAKSDVGYMLTPVNGGISEVNYAFPTHMVQNEEGVDLSSYAVEAISSPIQGEAKSDLETNATWYLFSFPRMPDVDSLTFQIVTELGTFTTTKIDSSSEDLNGIFVANFSAEQIQEFNNYAADALLKAVQAIQASGTDEQIASYLAVSDIVSEVSTANEKRDENMVNAIAQITGVEVYQNEITSGIIPIAYNYHMVGTNTVSMKANIKFILNSGGECRRSATILLRKINDHWGVVGVSKNILENVSSLDPEW